MKILSQISLCALLLLSCNQAIPNNTKPVEEKIVEPKIHAPVLLEDVSFNFDGDDVAKIPSGWSQYVTGKGKQTDWQIVNDNGNHVLAQLSEDNPNYHFNGIVFDGLTTVNIELSVRMKGVKGKMDQGGGFVWRFIDADNYYVVRANPLEDNVVLYKVENGKRTDLPLIGKGKTYGTQVDPLGNDWNVLKLTVSDSLFTVYLNGTQIFQVRDETFKGAGKVGLWTKADAVTYFDDFQITHIVQ